jgi:hypothetical protein
MGNGNRFQIKKQQQQQNKQKIRRKIKGNSVKNEMIMEIHN